MTPGPTDLPAEDGPSGAQVERVIGVIGGLRDEVADLKKAADGDRAERVLENQKRDRRIRWSRAAIAASILIGVGGLGLGYKLKATQDDIKHSVCIEAESFTNSLIRLSPPPTSDEERTKLQDRINTFKVSLEQDLSDLDCTLHLIEAPAVHSG